MPQQLDIFSAPPAGAAGLLWNLIKIPSVSREETAVADYLQHFLEEAGYSVNRSGNNIWLMSPGFDMAKPTLLLHSHIDTVKPVSGWTRDPFTPEIQDGRLYGLGSNEAGGCVVSLLYAYMRLSATAQPYNLIFAAGCEEEVSGRNGVEALLKDMPQIDFAIVGEPTDMQPAVAEKGLMVLDVTAYGKAGHAARNEGENAIYKCLKDIEWFRQYRFPKVSPLLGEVRMNVTQIQAGTQHNVIPDKCSFVVDIRTNECYSNAGLLEEIIPHVSCEVKARSTRLNSSATPMEHPIVQRILDSGRTPFGSPTLSDQAQMPFPTLKIGPGASARSHTANEYVLLQEIDDAIELYVQWLNQLSFPKCHE